MEAGFSDPASPLHHLHQENLMQDADRETNADEETPQADPEYPALGVHDTPNRKSTPGRSSASDWEKPTREAERESTPDKPLDKESADAGDEGAARP
jgi:hypothetical protein